MESHNTPFSRSPESELLNKKIDLVEEKLDIVEQGQGVRQDVRRELYVIISKWGSIFSILLALIGYFGIEKYVNWKIDQVTVNKYKEITEEQTLFMKRVALQFQLKEIQNKTDKKKYEFEDAKTLVKEAKETGDKELIKDCLDELFRITFLLGKYESMENLRKEYEDENELFKPRTWANIAIANMYLYGESKNEPSRQVALNACRESLKQFPSYGEPQAVKLIIAMIDNSRATTGTSRSAIQSSALQLVTDIVEDVNSKTQQATAYETYNRLVKYQNNAVLKKYINMLFELYPEQMRAMEDIYYEYSNKLIGNS